MELTLRERRLAAGFTTMRVFADAVGISRTRLFNLEFGRLNFKNLKPDEQAKIAEVLHCEIADLKKKSAQGSSFGRCKTTTVSPTKIEEMLAKEYGNKLKPIDKNAQPPVCYSSDC